MKSLLKWTSIFVGVLVLTLITVIVILTSVIKPDQYKALIITEFKQFTGFEMSIPGQLSWSFFPHLGMEATEVTVTDPGVFSAHLKNLVMHLRFNALLHQQLDLTKVSIDQLQVNHLQAANVQAKIHYQDRILEIRDLTAILYQGQLNSDAQVSMTAATPRFSINGKLNQVELAGLLQGLSGKTSRIQVQAKGDLNWDLKTEGTKTDELLTHLNGKSQARVSQGSIKGLDLDYYINTAAALINREPVPKENTASETQFTQLTGTAIIKDGIMTTDNFTLDSPLYSAKAIGSVDLVNKTIDYHVDLSSKISQNTHKLLSLYGKTVPVRISGDLSDPSVSLDTLALMKEVGKEQLQKVGEEIQKALPDKANAFIKSLFH